MLKNIYFWLLLKSPLLKILRVCACVSIPIPVVVSVHAFVLSFSHSIQYFSPSYSHTPHTDTHTHMHTDTHTVHTHTHTAHAYTHTHHIWTCIKRWDLQTARNRHHHDELLRKYNQKSGVVVEKPDKRKERLLTFVPPFSEGENFKYFSFHCYIFFFLELFFPFPPFLCFCVPL